MEHNLHSYTNEYAIVSKQGIADKQHSSFAFWFAISFILNGYSSGVPGASLGTIVFVIMIFFSLLQSNHSHIKVHVAMILLVSIFFVITCIDIAIVDSVGNVSIGILKLIVWTMMICWVCPVYFRYDEVLKWFTRIANILMIYLIIQITSYVVFSFYLPNIFDYGLIKPYDDVYANMEGIENFAYRPASFLSESSFCGNYLLCTLVMYLDKCANQIKRNQILYALFISMGIVLCTSTSAIVLLLIVWLIFYSVFPQKWKFIILIIVSCISIYIVTGHINQNSKLGYSMVYAFDKFSNLDHSRRFGRSYDYLDLLSPSEKWFGVGVGNEMSFLKSKTSMDTLYLNSISTILVQTGYMGLFVFFIFILALYYRTYKAKSLMAFSLLLAYTIKGFASGIYFSTYGIMFLMIIYSATVYRKYCYGS